MQIATQMIAQRATPATRTTTTTTKSRWQPYIQPTASTSTLPSRSPYISSASQIQTTPEASTSRSCPPATPQHSKESLQSKQKYALGLIDQAVYTLADIWRPHDIPKAFLPPKVQGKQPLHLLTVTQQGSSKTQPTLPHTSTNSSQKNTTPALIATGTDPDQNLSSLKSFVHEVLKRSRTSGTVLQTALCYLEAVRLKVPEILNDEKMGIRSYYQPDSTIQPATAAELAREAELAVIDNCYDQSTADDSMKTVRVTDSEGLEGMEDFSSVSSSISPEPQLTASTSTSLPSPLLCPRRAFLASLILASKFSQDKCYSNRAWAKLSGLPPREVGRCERALGQALDWRLWVGKSSAATPPPPTTATVRGVQKCHSEQLISSTPCSQEKFDRRTNAPTQQTSLRRCSTAPEAAFGARVPVSVAAASTSATACTSSSSSSNSSDDDLYMAQFPEAPKQEYSIPSSSASEAVGSPSPETPGLTFSPTSSVSSGDQTIQMSTFEDNNFAGLNVSQLWSEGSESRMGVVATTPGMVTENVQHPVFVVDNKKLSSVVALAYQMQQRIAVAVVDSESSMPYNYYADHNLSWRPETGFIALEATAGGGQY